LSNPDVLIQTLFVILIFSTSGAGSNLATEAVARAAPDGYTLLLIGGANTINATLFDKLNFDFLRDIGPVASVFERSFGSFKRCD
jgi:tripartite-type tricarboxylate transporter receptor subunit TctC